MNVNQQPKLTTQPKLPRDWSILNIRATDPLQTNQLLTELLTHVCVTDQNGQSVDGLLVVRGGALRLILSGRLASL